MEYTREILNSLVDIYERRGYDLPAEGRRHRAVTLDVEKCCPEYRDHLCAEEREIDAAVTALADWKWVLAPRNAHGYYTRLTLCEERVGEICSFLGRKPAQTIRQEQLQLLREVRGAPDSLAVRFAAKAAAALEEGRSPGYGLQGDTDKLRDVLLALEKIGQLKKETYLRNFSEAVFHDSKRFQAILGIVRNVLADLTEQSLGKDRILEYYNLFENPTYLYLKGGWVLELAGSAIHVADLPGGIGLAANALSAVRGVHLRDRTVISVENLTTYHDMSESGQAVLYLGGFPNLARAGFLRMVYANEPDAAYFHYGDLDPHGFLILESLKQKTGIPFRPMRMDLATLQRCFATGHYRPLTEEDHKAMGYPMLAPYEEIFAFMRENNCKAEQESMEAMGL